MEESDETSPVVIARPSIAERRHWKNEAIARAVCVTISAARTCPRIARVYLEPDL